MSDLIDRQATIKDLYTINPQIPLRSLNDVECFLEAQPSVQQWIPVTKRLPENPKSNLDVQSYLTCINYHRMQILDWCDGWNCCFKDDGSIYRDSEFKDVVAWMPLPEPYKKRRKK